MDYKYCHILANCKHGQTTDGVDKGGEYIRKILEQTKFKTNDYKIINNCEFKENRGYEQLFLIHQEILNNNQIPITLGGDHSIGQSTVGSCLQKYGNSILVLWIDAHADINTRYSSLSGNTHGMPLAGLVGLERPWIDQITSILNPNDLIYYGIRDLDEFEKQVLKNNEIKTVNLDELEKIVDKYENVVISFDVDSLDKKYMDSTGTISERGITPDEVIKCFQIVGNKLRAFDITEFNPELGDLDNSLKTLENIIKQI